MKILVLGAGRMGRAIAFDLAGSEGVKDIVIADMDEGRAMAVKKFIEKRQVPGVTARQMDVTDVDAVVPLMRGCDAAISAVTYRFNYGLARAAVQAGTHFCDLGGNNDIVGKELALDEQARDAGITIIPDCGLAPGLVSILSADAKKRFEGMKGGVLQELHLRVGGLPRNPKPPLNYKIVFSPSGLINEYRENAVVIRKGELKTVESMIDMEEIEFPDPFGKLEAFNTSGGTSTLPATFLGSLEELDYKTIRYRGHCELMKAMLDLGLAGDSPIEITPVPGEGVSAGSGHGDDSGGGEHRIAVVPRQFFEALLLDRLSDDDGDVVLVRVIAKGKGQGKEVTITYTIIDQHDGVNDITAMMRMTAYPASIIAQMLASGVIGKKGAVPQELCVPTEYFLDEMRKRGIEIDIETS